MLLNRNNGLFICRYGFVLAQAKQVWACWSPVVIFTVGTMLPLGPTAAAHLCRSLFFVFSSVCRRLNIQWNRQKQYWFKIQRYTCLLSSEEEQNVPFILFAHVDLDHSADGRLQVVPLRLRRVENLHGVRASGDGQQRALVEVHLELTGVERGAHDDHLDREGQRRGAKSVRDNVFIKRGERKDKSQDSGV